MNNETTFITLPPVTPLELRMLQAILSGLYAKRRNVPDSDYMFLNYELVLDKTLGMDTAFAKLYYKLDDVRCKAEVRE